jgi:O-acetyl-ADP-ribose deacetylase (regulator of RNase III)
VIEILRGSLVGQPVAALLLSANNRLAAGSGWSLEVKRLAGPSYAAECRALASVGPVGLPIGGAAITGGGKLARGGHRRWILQAITIGYRADGSRIPATPGVLYASVRVALEHAEVFRMRSIATYLMAQRPKYATCPPEEMAEALCSALVDHAAVATSVERIIICERADIDLSRAAQALHRAKSMRGSR